MSPSIQPCRTRAPPCACRAPRGFGVHVRRSAHLLVGNPYLTLGNENVRSRTSAALGVVRDAAVHRPLDTHTQATRACVRVKVRPQNSHVVKLERCAKLTDLSDLMLADRGGERYGALAAFRHRPEGFCCSIMVGRDVCHYCEVDEGRRDLLDGTLCSPRRG